MIKLNCLGRPTLTDSQNSPVDFSSNKVFALFIYLAVTAKPVNRSELEGLLWGGSEAKKAQTSLRSAIYNINKQLDGILETGRKTVQLSAEGNPIVDLNRFDQLIQSGRQADLEAACDLVRGPFLERLEIDDAPQFDHWMISTREHYRVRTFEALSRLGEMYTVVGDNQSAIQALYQLLELEPWQEEGYRKLMRILGRQGEYNQALKVYQRCRDSLMDELEIEPMPETVALQEEIKRLRDRPVQHNLPAVTTTFVGRSPELTQITGQLLSASGRLVSLVGYGGIGKSSLALKIGHQLARNFMHGVTFVPLASIIEPAFVELSILDGLAAAPSPQADPRRYLIDQLSGEERLLILDNAEHLLDHTAELVDQLLKASQRLTILVTSREPLMLREEAIVRLDGLPFDASDQTIPTASQLFESRAKQATSTFELTPTNLLAVNRICALFEGLPLAIELTAAQTATQSCAAIEAMLRDRINSLTTSFRDLPPRQRSFQALFDQSWHQLTPRLQNMLADLSCFRGGFSLESAKAVCGVTQHELGDLYAKSLLQHSNGRFDMHNLVAHYAAERLMQAEPEKEKTHQAHSRYFCGLLNAAVDGRPRSDGGKLKALRADVENVRAACLFLAGTAEWGEIQAIAHPLAQFIETSNSFQEGTVLFRRMLDRLNANHAHPVSNRETEITAAVLTGRLAVQLVRTGAIPEALQRTNDAIEVLTSAEERMELGFVLNLNGVCRLLSSDLEGAIDRFEQCSDIYLAEDAPEALKPLVNLGSLYMRSGRYDEAIDRMLKGVPKAKANGDDRALAHLTNNISACYILTDRFEQGLDYCNRSIEVCDRIGFFSVKTVALQNRAELQFYAGEFEKSLATAEESLDLAREIGSGPYELISLKKGMLAANRLGEATDKRDYYLAEGHRLATGLNIPAPVLEWLAGIILLLVDWEAHQKTSVEMEVLKTDLIDLLHTHPATQKPALHEIRHHPRPSAAIDGERSDPATRLKRVLDRIRQTLLE